MKKQYPTSKKARSESWGSHLTKRAKRMANKSTRRLVNKVDADSFMFPFSWE